MNEVKCPICGSNQIHAGKKGFKAGRANLVNLFFGLKTSLLIGAYGSNDIIITCLSCGKQFEPGQGRKLPSPKTDYTIPQKGEDYICSHCQTVSYFNTVNKKCPSCGKYIREIDACSKQEIRKIADDKLKTQRKREEKIIGNNNYSSNRYNTWNFNQVLLLTKYSA